ncbi:MAG: AbrB/MazE/SpoVT family DNA-binding domain-containing protein [Actinobacteria bacterium]|nr:AbrB/MazE/SpoVT family DNA-binding domain-containing protein [Actinomycetota bacterium]
MHAELWRATIRRTTVFKSGNSQVVRLPKDFQIADREVQIVRQGTDIVIRPIPKTIGEALSLLPPCPDDMFTESRDVSPPPQRDWW